MCRFDCPALQISKRETYAPANKTRTAYFMGMGRVSIDHPSAIKTLYACMNCDACRHWCPMDISAGDCLADMRSELDKRDLIPTAFIHLKDRTNQTHSIFEESPFTAESEFNINMPNPQVFYFIGCMSAHHRPETVRATIGLLNHLKIPFCTQMENRQCCGSPLLEVGYKQSAIQLGQRNVDLINNSKVKLIISDCPGCVDMLQNHYLDLGLKLQPKVMHATQYLASFIQSKKLTPKIPQKFTITYHDPCVLSRKLHASEAARQIMAAIPELTLQEAYLHGEETQCCGYGGGYHISNEQFSNEIGLKRLAQLRKFEPDYISSSLPYL